MPSQLQATSCFSTELPQVQYDKTVPDSIIAVLKTTPVSVTTGDLVLLFRLRTCLCPREHLQATSTAELATDLRAYPCDIDVPKPEQFSALGQLPSDAPLVLSRSR